MVSIFLLFRSHAFFGHLDMGHANQAGATSEECTVAWGIVGEVDSDFCNSVLLDGIPLLIKYTLLLLYHEMGQNLRFLYEKIKNEQIHDRGICFMNTSTILRADQRKPKGQ
ncbi:hypothetical protein Hanom_Chr02g00102371 [Helianthus anomalus]